MKRLLQISGLLLVIFLVASDYSSANCFVSAALPGGGNSVICDDNIPNPSLTGVQVGSESTNNDDVITIQQGAGINVAGNGVNAGLGADQITVNANAGNITGGNNSLFTEGSNNVVDLNGGNLIGGNNGVFFNIGDNNSAMLTNTTINSGNNAIFFNNGNNNSAVVRNSTIISNGNGIFFNVGDNRSLEFHSGSVVSDFGNAIFMNSGDSNLHVNGGSITSMNGFPIFTNSGDDLIVFRGGEIVSENPTFGAIRTSSGNDTVRIERLQSLMGRIEGGDDIDTLIFAQRIGSQATCNTLRDEIAALNPANDSITINGILYEWIEFENIEDNLICSENIPTLSEWGLIAMAGILGIVGLIVVRKKKLAL